MLRKGIHAGVGLLYVWFVRSYSLGYLVLIILIRSTNVDNEFDSVRLRSTTLDGNLRTVRYSYECPRGPHISLQSDLWTKRSSRKYAKYRAVASVRRIRFVALADL